MSVSQIHVRKARCRCGYTEDDLLGQFFILRRRFVLLGDGYFDEVEEPHWFSACIVCGVSLCDCAQPHDITNLQRRAVLR